MGLFDSKPKQQLRNINVIVFDEASGKNIEVPSGYIIDEITGMLVDVPKGLRVYNIPKEVKQLNPRLNLVANGVLKSLNDAEEIIFEAGSIEKLPAGYFTFLSKSNVKKIILPNGIKYLGDNCIDSTRTKYNLPATLEYLGKNMYPEVQELVIGSNVKSLGNSFASHDTNLIHVEVAGSIKELPSDFVNQCKNLKTLVLHEGIEKAGANTFRNLNSLEYVELPNSFKMPFQTSMEHRGGNNKRGNSEYSDSNGVFEVQQNSILTIKKIHNAIPYTFQIRRGDFSEISFQNKLAIIKSPTGKGVSIELDLVKNDVICVIDMQKENVEQVMNKQQIQPQTPIQRNIPTPTQPLPEPLVYTDDEIISDFQKVYKEYVISTSLFQDIADSKTKMMIKSILFEQVNKRLQAGIKVGKKYPIDGNYLYDSFERILIEIKTKEEQSSLPIDSEQKKHGF